MKKLLLITLLILGCGGDGITGPSSSELIGTWDFVSETTIESSFHNGETYEHENNSFASDDYSRTLTFAANNTWSQVNYTYDNISTWTGTYSLSGNTLSFTVDYGGGNAATMATTISISGNLLTYTFTQNIDGSGSISQTSIWQKSN